MDTIEVTSQETVEEEGTEEQGPALNGFMLQNGFPLFLGEVDDIIDRVRALGYNIFYVLGTHITEYEVTNSHTNIVKVEKSPPTPRVFRVTTNNIGYAIDTVDTDGLGLTNIEPTALMQLPRIPFELIQKLDAFFRAVYKRNHTEAIAILTFDPLIEDERGWGFVVPKQENTMAKCTYKPESVIDELVDLNEGRAFEDQIFTTGSAHSHPGMSAYASPTDHDDQDKNDGLHITFGWKHGSNATEHYIELQMGGTAFSLDPNQTFTDAPEPPVFPEIEDWITAKVEKQSTSTTYPTNYPKGPGLTGFGNSGPTYEEWGYFDHSRSGSGFYDQNQKGFDLPDGCPNIKESTVAVRLLSSDETRCPVCLNFLTKESKDKRRCWDCMCFLLFPNETIEDIIEVRLGYTNASTFALRKEHADKDIMIWNRRLEDDKVVTATVIYFLVSEGKD